MGVVHQQFSEIPKPLHIDIGKKGWPRQAVKIALLVIAAFLLINLTGALLNKNIPVILIILPGLALCGLALLFQHIGKTSVVSVLLILVVNLGCGVTLLTAPGGLDVVNLPVFDILIVSELMAVFLLPAESVFLVALTNALFTFIDITFQHHTATLGRFLASSTGYTAIIHPLSLQIIVAVITYIWVRSTQYAMARAARAEEIAELRKREAERKHQLDTAIEQISQALVSAANGDRSVRVDLSQNNMLWRVGNLFNSLMTRLAKASQLEQENQRLRVQIARLTEAMKEVKISSQQEWRQPSK